MYSEFQENMFGNGRDITKCHSFCMTVNNTDAKPMAIPQVFSENSQAKEGENADKIQAVSLFPSKC